MRSRRALRFHTGIGCALIAARRPTSSNPLRQAPLADTPRRQCQNCGSISDDLDWCDVCGADLAAQRSAATWLDVGDTFVVPRFSLPAAPPRRARHDSGGDTLVPFADDPSRGRTLQSGPQLHEAVTLEIRRADDAAVGDTLRMPVVPDAEDGVQLEVSAEVSRFTHKRVFLAKTPDGTEFRVEERARPTSEAVPAGARHLGWVVDLPLAATDRGGHEIRVYRSVPGVMMHERYEARDEPLTPSDIVEWISPVVDALSAIHDAGFLCLRICPYTIKYTVEGVFLQGVEVLYPQDASLEKLPAIAGYTPPEVYAASVGEPPSTAADVYMVAMVVYYLIARADPPASMYTGYSPTILARDFAPEFPLGFAPVLGQLGALHPADRPRSAAELLDALEHARSRVVRPSPDLRALRLAAAADTHVGIIKRLHTAENQDAVFAAVDDEHSTCLLLVADGVSTASFGSGDLASRVARDTAVEAWLQLEDRPETLADKGAAKWIDELLQTINRRIVDAVNELHAPFEGEPSEVMGSTCVVALIRHGICHLAALGDSRAYLLRDGVIEQVNRDHNLLTLGIVQGLDPDVALTLPQGDALAKCLGAFDVDGGLLIPVPVEPDEYVFALRAGDRLLLCSDGLTDYSGETVGESEANIYEVAMAAELPELACLDLIRLANSGGGGDNIGCAMVIVEPTWLDAMAWFSRDRDGLEDADPED